MASRSAAIRSVPLWTGSLIVSAFLLGTAVACRRATEGHLTYVLDDSYIQMARNLALHGSWGVNPGSFEPASSSPLWTVLLALAYRLTGVRDSTPFALNLGICLVLLWVVESLLRGSVRGAWRRAALATAIVLLAPATVFAITGMEHGLHTVLAISLAWAAARRIFTEAAGHAPQVLLAGSPPGARGVAHALAQPGGVWPLVVLAALSTLARFESLSLIAVLVLAALLRRRQVEAVALLAGVILALGGYMAFALPRGGLWMPNSILLKSSLGVFREGAADWASFAWRIPRAFAVLRNAHVPALIVAAAATAVMLPRSGDATSAVSRGLLLVVGPVVLLQVQCAELASFFRYESWLVALGLTALAAALPRLGWRERRPGRPPGTLRWLLSGALVAALGFLLVVRAYRATAWAPFASRNIYEQQYQMARFVHDRFSGQPVAISDLGAVGYYGGARAVDLAGLAAMPVARARLAGRSDSRWLAWFCAQQGVRVALLYESWLLGRGGIPPTWRPIARWTIHDNYAAAGNTITIFCTDPAYEGRVRAAVRAFEPKLPRRVEVQEVAH